MDYGLLDLSAEEKVKLYTHIFQDFISAKSNHDARTQRFIRYYRLWRGLNESPSDRDTGEQLQVPMLKWTTFSHWARVVEALFGADAEVIAKPTSPLDVALVEKVGRYMGWRVFEYMKGVQAISTWAFRAVLFGRSHAYVPFAQQYFWERQTKGPLKGQDIEKLVYDGPQVTPLWPSELVIPAQDGAMSISDFEWKIRRVRMTPQELLDGERHGRFQDVEKNYELINNFAQQKQERDYTWDDEKIDKDEAEGVSYANTMGNRNSLEVWEWYGKWRLPKSNKVPAAVGRLSRRQSNESDLLVTVLPRVSNLVIGITDLRELYPRQAKRDPFLDIGLVKDGSYWCPGVGELVEDLQRKATANYALFERAGKFSVGPLIFYKPSAGSFDPDTFEYEPMKAIPSEDPASVQVVKLDANFEFSEKNQQALQSFNEKVTGDTDSSQGVSSDRPNAPRTASGQMLLAQGANTRIALDMTFLREDISTFLEYVWLLDREYAGEEVFFRVTEEDTEGLGFETENGFGAITAAEREHSFDFQLKFADTVWSREANKERAIQLYGLAIQNPLIQQNPRALWAILNKVWQAVSKESLSNILPAPPELDEPKDPKQEWSLILRREDVDVNPLDDDDKHILDHTRRLETAKQERPDRMDQWAIDTLAKHIHQHQIQKRMKMVLEAMAQKYLAAAQESGASGASESPAQPAGAASAAGPGPQGLASGGPPAAPGPQQQAAQPQQQAQPQAPPDGAVTQ